MNFFVEQDNDGEKQPNNEKRGILYGIDDIPPWYLSIPMAFQHYLTMIGAIVSIPFILTPALCMSDEDPARGLIISTMIFVTGMYEVFYDHLVFAHFSQ